MKRYPPQSGFTLLEIIITVMVTAILSAIIIQAMGTNVQRSAFPLFAVRNSLSLQQVMENITADYKQVFLTDSNPMDTFLARIDANNSADGPYWTPSGAFTAEREDIDFTTENTTTCEPAYNSCWDEAHCSDNCRILQR
jgi:prepilin-type N-terminal cleavage/methylation domain-containing protein